MPKEIKKELIFSALLGILMFSTILSPSSFLSMDSLSDKMLDNEGNFLNEEQSPITAADISPWWNEIYEYRIKITVSPGAASQTNYPAEYYLDFTQFLVDNGIPLSQSNRVNATNLRIIEQTDTTIVSANIPIQYDARGSSLTDQGELAWIIEGSFNLEKTYYLYFCLGDTDAFDNPIIQSDYSRSLAYKPFRIHHEGFEYTTSEFQTYKSSLNINTAQTGASGNPNYAYVQNTTIDGRRGDAAFTTSGNLWVREQMDTPIVLADHSALYFTYSAKVYDVPAGSATNTDYDIIGAEVSSVTTWTLNQPSVMGPQVYGTQNYYDTSYFNSPNNWHYYSYDIKGHFSSSASIYYIYFVHDDDDGTGDDPDNDGDQFYSDFPVSYDDLSIWNVTVSKDSNIPAVITATTLDSVFSNFQVQILDLDGFPVPNAEVKIWNQTRDWNQTGSTDEDGVQIFGDVSIEQIYNVSVSYTTSGVAVPVEFPIAFLENVKLTDFNFNLTINSSIWSMDFHINDYDGDPVDNGFVILYDLGQPVYNGSLNSDGYTTLRYKNDTSYDYKVFYDTSELGELYDYADTLIEIESGAVTRDSATEGTWVEYGLVDQVNLVGSGNYTGNSLAIFNTTTTDFNNALIGTAHVDLINFTDSITGYTLYGYDFEDTETEIVSKAGSFSSNVSFDATGFESTRFRLRVDDTGVVPLQGGVINVSYYLRTTEIINCNISTVTLNISGDTGDTVEPLANAVILLTNQTSGASIANLTTTTSGVVDFTYFRYTPESYGNFSLQIKFVGSIANINQTNAPTNALPDWGEYQHFTIDTKDQKDVLVNFRETNYLSQINVTNLDPTVTVSLTWGDLQTIQVNYTFIQGSNDPVSLPVDKMEYLIYDAELSLIMVEEMIWIQNGEYTFDFDSGTVIADTQYTIKFRATKAGYPDPAYRDEIRINVNQVPTQAEIYDTTTGVTISGTEIERKWGEVFNVTVTYQSSGDLSYLEGANVDLSWYFDPYLSMWEESNNGVTNYTVEIDTSKVTSLDKYRVDISANLQNHTIQILHFDLNVVEISTTINADDYSDRMDLYWKENMSISVNYTDTFNEETVTGAYVYYTIVGDAAFNEYTIPEFGITGIYEIEINSTQFNEAGNYTLQVVAMKNNFVTQQMWVSFTIKILPTTFTSEVSDTRPYWREEFTIQLNYTDSYYVLPISDVDVSYTITGSEFTDSGTMSNDGNGIYSVIYNTTYFPKAGIYSFEFSVEKLNYESQTHTILIEIEIIPVNFTAADSQFDKELNQEFTISVLAEDVRNGSPIQIPDGTVSFTVTGPNNFLKTGFIESVGDGVYNATFDTSIYFDGVAGTYSFLITFAKNQYETSTLTVTVNIAIIPTTLTTPDSEITLYWEESFTIAVTYLDARDNTPLTGATITYSITGPSSFSAFGSLPHTLNGEYSLEFLSDIDFPKGGTYTFAITAIYSEHQTQILSITINIENVPTEITPASTILNVYWGDDFTILVLFEDLRDLGSPIPITSGATISYEVTGPVGYFDNGDLAHFISNPGTYRNTFDSTTFNYNGTYNFQITAAKNQYETQIISITVYINIIPTELTAQNYIIPVNWGETFNLSVYYEDLYNSFAIDTLQVTYTATGPEDYVDAGDLSPIGSGFYIRGFSAIEGGNFIAGTYYFQIIAQKSQYETQILTITVNIAVIETTLTIDGDEEIAVPWENNFTIGVIYYDEDNLVNITDATVGYTVTGHPEFQGTISYSATFEMYFIEFNTTTFGTTGTYTFTITASKNQYENQQMVINVDIGIRPINFTTNATEITLYWGDVFTLAVNLFDIEDSENPIAISEADITYEVSGTNNYSDSGVFIYSGSNGLFILPQNSIDYSQTGSYTFQVTVTKTEYATRTLVIAVTILTIPTQLSTLYVEDTIELVWEETEVITVSFDDLIDSGSPAAIIGATVSYYAPGLVISSGTLTPVGDGTYTFDLDSLDFSTAGTYNFRVTATKNQYETQQVVITLQISMVSTSFATLQTNYTLTWRDTIEISVLFSDTYRSLGITDGEILFSVGQQFGFEGEFTHAADGSYEFLLNTTDFEGVGSYTIHVTANKYQYSSQTITFYIVINPIQTRINETIFLREDISINVTTHHEFLICYSELGGTMITGADIAYFEWEDGTTTHTGYLEDLANGYYRLDFNTLHQPIGTYLIAIYVGKHNFVTRSATITLNIVERPVSIVLGDDIVTKVAETPEGNHIVIEFSLTDPVDGTPLTDAIVTMEYRGKNIPIPESDIPGTYRHVIETETEEYNALVAAITDTATISIQKANYTIDSFDITISVTPPEFVVGSVGVPKIFVYIGATVALLAIAIAGTTRYIRYARIPLIVKQIDSTKKLMGGNKTISDENLTNTYEEEIIELYHEAWDMLDLDLKEILGSGSSSSTNIQGLGDINQGGN
ncbi:MAG: hypothetical protein ACTSYI_12615 [Promethearchaeota archaeon]